MIVHRNGETSVRDSLSAVEKALGSREFIVADRGYLANIRHVMKMKSRELYMRNGNIITVGRERFKHVRKAILDYWRFKICGWYYYMGWQRLWKLGLGCGCLVGCFQNGNPVQNTDGQK